MGRAYFRALATLINIPQRRDPNASPILFDLGRICDFGILTHLRKRHVLGSIIIRPPQIEERDTSLPELVYVRATKFARLTLIGHVPDRDKIVISI